MALSESASASGCIPRARTGSATEHRGAARSSGWESSEADELNYCERRGLLFVTAPSADDDLARSEWLRLPGIPFGSMPTCGPRVVRARSPARSTATARTGSVGPDTWEFQALIKARAVAGSAELGSKHSPRRRRAQVWDRAYSADELALIRKFEGAFRGDHREPRPLRAGA